MKIQAISVTQRKPSRATTTSTLFTVSKDEWNPKEDTGKSLKNTLDVLQFANHFCIQFYSTMILKMMTLKMIVSMRNQRLAHMTSMM